MERKLQQLLQFKVPTNDERQMQLRKILLDDKTQLRVILHHVADKYDRKGEIGESSRQDQKLV